jgi:hypothetical protein
MRYGSAGVGSGHRMAARFQALNPARDQTPDHEPVEAEVEVLAPEVLVVAASPVWELTTASIPDAPKPTVGGSVHLFRLWVSLWVSRQLNRLVRLGAKPIPTTQPDAIGI